MNYEVWNGSNVKVIAESNAAGCVGLVTTGDKLADEEGHSKRKDEDEQERRCQDASRGGGS